jgi:hypothetical protein
VDISMICPSSPDISMICPPAFCKKNPEPLKGTPDRL